MPDQRGPPTSMPVHGPDPNRVLVPTPAPQPARWGFPVDHAGAWYCATWHDLTGAKNGGYAHTGLDLNLDRDPWGDVERGRPVFALADGVVDKLDFHERYRGCVMLIVQHAGEPLWMRYWHLSRTCLDLLQVGQRVGLGTLLGHIGAYANAGDHIHLDMALDPFEPRWWFTRHAGVRWVDPVPVLGEHCTASELHAMLRKGGEEYEQAIE